MKALPEKLAEQYADDKSKAYYIGENGEKKWYVTPRGQHSKEAFLAGYKAAKDETNLPTSAKWISVKERLPEVGAPCLVTCHEERYAIAEYDGIKWTTLNSIAYYHPIVTHWQWLPKVPKEEA